MWRLYKGCMRAIEDSFARAKNQGAELGWSAKPE